MKPVHDLIYLAGPYSHDDPAVRAKRFDQLTEATAILMNKGFVVYSPITHSHPIAVEHDLPQGWDYWQKTCEAMLSRCDSMIILQLDGWDTSIGVAGEVEIAERLEIPITHMQLP